MCRSARGRGQEGHVAAMLRVLTLLLRYGTTKYPDAEPHIENLFARLMPDIDLSTLIVDSALPPEYFEITAPRRTVIGADNRFSEWSAADRGIAFLGERIWSYDLIHVATAAFNTLYTAYLERFSMEMLRAIAGRAICVGHIDCYNDPVRLLFFRSQHWIRTSFVFLPPAELKALGSLVSISDPRPLFSGDPARPFREDAPLSKNYQDYIYTWLTGGDIGQGVQWHSGFGLTKATLPTFQQKTMAILNEHLFSIRLRAQGCKVVDTLWLASQLSRRPAAEIAWETVWRIQLAEREQDPLVMQPRFATAHA